MPSEQKDGERGEQGQLRDEHVRSWEIPGSRLVPLAAASRFNRLIHYERCCRTSFNTQPQAAPHRKQLRRKGSITIPNLDNHGADLEARPSSFPQSSLLTRFTDSSFTPEDESSATIGVDFRVSKMQDKKGRKVKLSIWVSLGFSATPPTLV